MIPGLNLYRALAGALQLARLPESADPGTVAGTLGNASHGFLVVGALSLGLVLGARTVLALAGELDSPMPERDRSPDLAGGAFHEGLGG